MAKEKTNNITKPEVKFWLAILGVIVGAVMAFTQLQSQVGALDTEVHDKGKKLREEFETDSQILQEVNERSIRLEANQALLMKAFNLTPVEIEK